MVRAAVSSVIAIVLTTVIFGFAYPLLMTGFAQATFSNKANGSLIENGGKVVGSKLVAQGFSSPQYFHPRPTATSPPYTAEAAGSAATRPSPTSGPPTRRSPRTSRTRPARS